MAIFRPGVSGAFSAWRWFWVDAVVCSSVKVSFLHYLPGIFASLAALMFNCVRKEDIDILLMRKANGGWGLIAKLLKN
ncbi:OLC1v1001182C1 [Oldenlandia corymbosa var. corymbosa]|uniref:OLC1v1001182C1 n=1 Tax=Oldenlandia corymbosa var. corymbosa TaxID=529605 RepID=A0AAV1D5H3_OLDCO|nr:OLC1v1001182C1 [Oldenlandia corymbosa var. corymbosa]